MLKIALKNYKTLIKIRKTSKLLGYFFTFNIKYLNIRQNIDYFDEIMLFHKNSNNTFKHTGKNRFIDIDRLSLEYIKENDAIHDIAVSSGVTSLDLLDQLNHRNIGNQFYISDKYSKINVFGDNCVKVYDGDNYFSFGYIFNVYCCEFGKCSKIFFISSILYAILRNVKLKSCREIILFNPQVIDCINNKKIINIDYDIFIKSHENMFNFIRCMNIFNKMYFSNDKLLIALKYVKDSMKQDAYLLIGRTLDNNKNIATIYQKKENNFIFIKDINGGTDIKDVMSNFLIDVENA
jgi:hypothetical protein